MANFTLVPNPNNGAFTINGTLRSLTDANVDIIITNVLGQTIYKKTALAQKGNVSEHISLSKEYPRGMYNVSVANCGEGNVISSRVVIDK